jgi:hypothetical protein
MNSAAPLGDMRANQETSMHVTGRCHCGKISYEADLDPGSVTICHCSDCQRLSGSPYRVSARVPAAEFRMLSGELRTYVKIAESGTRRVHAFCPDCGSPVYSSDVGTVRNYSLRVGCLDQRASLPPRRQIWCRSSLAWSRDVTPVPAVDRQ